MRLLPSFLNVSRAAPNQCYKVLDANGQSLAYVYGRETKADVDTAQVLTMDEARRIASNIAKLPNYLGVPEPD